MIGIIIAFPDVYATPHYLMISLWDDEPMEQGIEIYYVQRYINNSKLCN